MGKRRLSVRLNHLGINLLPHELLFQILIRLTAEELVRLKTVCKSWKDVISDPMFADSHLAYTKSKSPPMIVFQTIQTGNDIFSLNLQDKSMKARKFHLPLDLPPQRYQLKSQCNGLLLLGTYSCYPLAIYNPVTRIHKFLPYKRFSYSLRPYFALIYDSLVAKYKVFAIESGGRNCSVFTQGGKDWEFVCKGESEEELIRSSVFFLKNKLHFIACLLHHENLLCLHSIDVLKKKRVKMDTPFRIEGLITRHRLSEVRGSLAITNIFSNHLETWVLLDDNYQSLWTKYSVVSFDRLNSVTCFIAHTHLIAQYKDKLFIYDLETKELRRIKNTRYRWREYGFHVNSLVNWI